MRPNCDACVFVGSMENVQRKRYPSSIKERQTTNVLIWWTFPYFLHGPKVVKRLNFEFCSYACISRFYSVLFFHQVMRVNQCWQKDYTTLVEENNFCKVKLKSTEERVKSVEQENQKLQQRLLQLENQQALSPPTSKPAPIQTPHYTIDDIEALKQQVCWKTNDMLLICDVENCWALMWVASF